MTNVALKKKKKQSLLCRLELNVFRHGCTTELAGKIVENSIFKRQPRGAEHRFEHFRGWIIIGTPYYDADKFAVLISSKSYDHMDRPLLRDKVVTFK